MNRNMCVLSLAILLLTALSACGEGAANLEISLSGVWVGTTAPSSGHEGMEMRIELTEAPDGALTGKGDVRLTGGGGARAEVITIANGIHRPPEASFVLTNGVIFVGDVDPSGPSVHFRIVPRPDRPYPPTISLHRDN